MAHTTDAVGASRTTPSVLTKITSSAPRRSASRSAAMFTAYDSVLTPPSNQGASANAAPVKPRSSVITRNPSRRCCQTDSARGRTVSNPVGMPSAGPRVRSEFQSVLTRRSARVECGIDEGAPGRLIERDVERGRGSPHPGEVGRQLVDRTAASGVGLDPAALEAPVSAVDAAVVRPHYRTIRIDESFPKNAQDENGHRAQGRGELVSCADIGPRLRLT